MLANARAFEGLWVMDCAMGSARAGADGRQPLYELGDRVGRICPLAHGLGDPLHVSYDVEGAALVGGHERPGDVGKRDDLPVVQEDGPGDLLSVSEDSSRAVWGGGRQGPCDVGKRA